MVLLLKWIITRTVTLDPGMSPEVPYLSTDVSCLSLRLSSTMPWDRVPKFDNDQRPVGYVAKGSHGLWVRPGTFTYLNAVVFKLNDDTSDGGVVWDTKNSLLTINYPDSYAGPFDWLNFRGRWGNKANNRCWWYFAYKGVRGMNYSS